MTERAGLARFITLEGGEGAGKSTHAQRLSDALNARGIANIVTREPGGSEGAESIRKLLVEGEPGRWDPVVETLLMFAARADHLARTIRPALERGNWVICDRFTDSTFAYQGAGRGLGPWVIRQIDQVATGGFRSDLTIILDVPVEDALQRIGSRHHAEDRFEKFDRGFHERLRAHFQELAKEEPQRCVLINSAAPVEDVTAQIWRAVAERFGL
jgi:dTMP kinase